MVPNLSSPNFELTVLGCSGGPLDGRTCSYLLKPSKITYNEIVKTGLSNKFLCIDGGTGLSGLVDLISKVENDKVMEDNALLRIYTDSLQVSDYTYCHTTIPFDTSLIDGKKSCYQLGTEIMALLDNYLITHLHADHLMGLVVNSPGFKKKTINGSFPTLEILKKNIFNNRVWPELNTINFNVLDDEWYRISDEFDVRYFINSHGYFVERDEAVRYDSNAYLIRHVESKKLMLIFGDVEPDCCSKTGSIRRIWDHIAQLIHSKSLLAVVIECSNYNLPSDVPLYGHMTPNYLILELKMLEDIMKSKFGTIQPLKNLNIIVTHIKESDNGSDPRRRILKELHDLNDLHNLGIIFTVALPGLTYCL